MLDAIYEILGYTTARVLLPILSLGKVRVQKISSNERGFNWLGFRREPDGTILVESNSAGSFGLLLWFGALVLFTVIMAL